MSNLDTRKTGGGQTVSYATVRLESETLLPEQLLDRLGAAAGDDAEIELHVQRQGTGPAAR